MAVNIQVYCSGFWRRVLWYVGAKVLLQRNARAVASESFEMWNFPETQAAVTQVRGDACVTW